jgi:hypothetical protein
VSWRLTFLAAVAIVAIAGVAIAAQGGSKNVVLCAAKQGGKLRLASKGKCAKGERKLTIAKQGPRGVQGVAGAQGSPGTTASIQPEPVHAVAPASGSVDCEDAPGTFCSESGLGWTNYESVYAPAGFWKDAAGEVHLRGTIKPFGGPGAITNDFFFLPDGYRPVGTRQFVITNCYLDTIQIEIEPDGAVHTPSVGGTICAAFDGISFRP